MMKMRLYLLVFGLWCQQALGFGLTIPQQQVNDVVNLRFPLTQVYREYTLEASRPNISLFAHNQSVSIAVRVKLNDAQYSLLADAIFKGQITFDKLSNSLKVSDPAMTKFTILDNSFPPSLVSLDVIKDTVGQHLPISVLFDFTQIDPAILPFAPADMRIVEGGLYLEY